MSIIKVKDQEGNLINIPAFKGPQGEKGENGKDGAVFIPSIAENGDLSWSNNGGLQNPDTVNIKGPQGEKGESPSVDGTLTQSGQAADAKIVGDKFEEINNTLENFSALDKGLLSDGTDLNSVSEYGMYLLAPNYSYTNSPIQCGYLLVLPSKENNNFENVEATIGTATASVNFRNEPNTTTSTILTTVPANNTITIISEEKIISNDVTWIHAIYQNYDGWCSEKNFTISKINKNLSDISNSTGVDIGSVKTFSQIAINFDGSITKKRTIWNGIAYQWVDSSNLVWTKDYGYSLPAAGNPGRIYFKKVT